MFPPKNVFSQNMSALPFVIDASGAELKELTFISLPHPRHSTLMRYARTSSRVFEMQAHSEPASSQPTSWFYGSEVVSNGTMYIATPIDPLFLVLPILDQAAQRSIPDAQRRYTEIADTVAGNPAIASLLQLPECNLSSICDVKEEFDTKFVRFNSSKTLQWLRSKVNRTAKLLQKIGKDALDIQNKNATSSSFTLGGSKPVVAATAAADVAPTEFHIMSAIGLVADYLPAHLFDSLAQSFSLTVDEVTHRRRKGASNSSPQAALAPSGQSSPMAFSMPAFSTDTDFHDFSAQPSASNTGDVKRKPVEKEMTAGAKKLSKMSASESKGMQSISSFFGAKK